MSIADLNQPAKDWLADMIENTARLIETGESPVTLIEVEGVQFEFRLITDLEDSSHASSPTT